MRENKFRAWDVKAGKMAHVAEIKFNPKNCQPMKILCVYQLYSDEVYGGRSKEPVDIEEKWRSASKVILMQFTGLLDRNGKEIWEGDIVKVDRQDSFPSYNQAIVVYAKNHGAFLIQYTKDTNPKGILSMESISSKDGKTIFGYCTGWKLEVIGNILENPELLNRKEQQ